MLARMSTASALSRTPPPETSPSSAGEPGVAQVVVDSPIGPLLLVASEGALTHVWFDGLRHVSSDEADLPPDDAEVLGAATVQLAEYFAGERRAFDLPLRARGTTFQKGGVGRAGKDPVGDDDHLRRDRTGARTAVVRIARGGRG
jgi:methylated-DNA-[protein]-cysteine S-methyltransferase